MVSWTEPLTPLLAYFFHAWLALVPPRGAFQGPYSSIRPAQRSQPTRGAVMAIVNPIALRAGWRKDVIAKGPSLSSMALLTGLLWSPASSTAGAVAVIAARVAGAEQGNMLRIGNRQNGDGEKSELCASNPAQTANREKRLGYVGLASNIRLRSQFSLYQSAFCCSTSARVGPAFRTGCRGRGEKSKGKQ